MKFTYDQLKSIMEQAAKKIYTCNMYMIDEGNINVLQSEPYGVQKRLFDRGIGVSLIKSTIKVSNLKALNGVTVVDIVLTKAGLEYVSEKCPDLNINIDGNYTFRGSAGISLIDTYKHKFMTIILPSKECHTAIDLQKEYVESIEPYSPMDRTSNSFDIDWSLVEPAD